MKQTKTIANPIASINRFAVAHVVPSSCTGETTRAITGIVKTSSHMTVVAVRDENTATLQATSDAPINAAHVPGVIDTHAPPRCTATSSRPTDIQQTMPGRMETRQCAIAICQRRVADVSSKS